MSKKRESGFYFVKYDGEWIVVEWFQKDNKKLSGYACWFMPGDHKEYYDSDLDEIDERPIVREETKTEK